MKTFNPRISTNQILFALLSIALLVEGTIIFCFFLHISGFDELSLNAAHEHSFWSLAAIIIVLALTLLTWLTVIRNLRLSQQTIIANEVERERTEKVLRESEARYRIVTESASDVILTIDHESTILFVNSAAEKIFGYTVDEMIGKKMAMLMPESMRDAHAAGMIHYRETNERNISWKGVELPGLHKDGSEVPLEITFGEIKSDGKHLFTAVIRDISKRKEIESALLRSERYQRTLLENINEGLVQTNVDEVIEFVNDRFCEMTGFEREELIGKFSFNVIFDEEGNQFIRETNKRRFQGLAGRYEIRIKKKSGEMMWVIVGGSPVFDADGKVTGKLGVFTDITDRKQTEDTLRESEVRYRQLFDSNPHPVFAFDIETLQFLAVNDETIHRYGYSREEFLQMTVKDIRPPEDIPLFLQRFEAAVNGQTASKSRHLTKWGTIIDVEVSSHLISFDNRSALLILVTDVTERNRADAALRDSEYKFRTLITNMSEGLTQVSNDEEIEFVNDRLCQMTGYTREELLGKTTFDLLSDEDGHNLLEKVNQQRRQGISSQYEIPIKKKSGELIWVLISGSPIVNSESVMTGTLGIFTDITERKRAEEQLLHDAFHDGLTGLANRALFMDHLQMTIERGKSRHSNSYAVFFLDFDRFKVINDSLGHTEGDRLLNQISRRLESLTRTGDLVARFGGDEFVILSSEMLAESDAVLIAERIQNDLKKPFNLSGSEIYISASIGIALSNAGHKRAEDMVRDADIAMYRAKAKGKAQYQIFDQVMHDYASRQLRLETEMRQALERQEFQVHYQPIVNLQTETLIGFEALVRWQHPTRGMIPPFEFIGAAEENGLVLPLGKWILQESCRQLRHWQQDHPSALSLTMSVNLSCKQFLQLDLAEQITAALEESGINPRCLNLEITESHIMENHEMAVTIMNRLREIGVEISLDDFGTGYSSLSYLHSLPVDYLKVDRSFVSRMTDSRENGEIVRTIIKLAQNLRMKVIAEGIETADQLAHLKRLQCEYGQGYFFSKPLQAIAAEKFIEDNDGDVPLMIKQDLGIELNM